MKILTARTIHVRPGQMPEEYGSSARECALMGIDYNCRRRGGNTPFAYDHDYRTSFVCENCGMDRQQAQHIADLRRTLTGGRCRR